jgi:hypothetical protein
MDGTYLRQAIKVVPLLQNPLNAQLLLPILIPKVFSPRLKMSMHSLPSQNRFRHSIPPFRLTLHLPRHHLRPRLP